MVLPQKCEDILHFFISQNAEVVTLESILNEFSERMTRREIVFAIEELKQNGYLTGRSYDNYTTGSFSLTSKGCFYFDSKNIQPQQSSITINNSSNFNVGDNNSVTVNSGADFEEIRQYITQNNLENQETLLEVVNALQDCLENSKPLPKGRFARFSDSLNKCLPFLQLIGKVVTGYLSD